MHEKSRMPDTSNIAPASPVLKQIIQDMKNKYRCSTNPMQQLANGEPVNVNTFDGFIGHYFPRQVVKVRLDGHDLSGTVRKVHIDDNDDITYDIEIWAFDGFIVKDIHADLVFIQNFNK